MEDIPRDLSKRATARSTGSLQCSRRFPAMPYSVGGVCKRPPAQLPCNDLGIKDTKRGSHGQHPGMSLDSGNKDRVLRHENRTFAEIVEALVATTVVQYF